MSITLITQPSDLMPIHTPMMYLFTSDNSAEKNMKLIFNINIEGVERNISISPRPDGKIEFDISSHLRDYLITGGFNPSKILIDNTDNAPYVNYTVTVKEVWIDVITNMLIEGGETIYSEKTASNIVLNRSELINYSPDFYVNAVSEGAEDSNIQLNSKPNSTYYKDDIVWIHCVGIGFGLNRSLRLKEYDNEGALLTTHAEVMSLFDKVSVFYKLDLSTYSFNINTKRIGIEFITNDIDLNFFSLTYENTYKLKDVDCSSFDKYRLIYLDKLGSYNTISLNYASNESISITKENFRSRLDSFNSIDSSRGLQTYFTDAKESYTLNTGNLNADDMAKFEDLLLSGSVMLDVRSHPDNKFDGMSYVPFMINTKSMKRYKSENQQIAQYTIEGELGYKLNVRR